VTALAWNPNPKTPVVIAAVEDHILLLDPGVSRDETAQNIKELLMLKRGQVKLKEGNALISTHMRPY